MANNLFFTNRFGIIYLAIYPPSIITANVRPPSASMDFFNFSETRACSLRREVLGEYRRFDSRRLEVESRRRTGYILNGYRFVSH